jgi:hypothetical protein
VEPGAVARDGADGGGGQTRARRVLRRGGAPSPGALARPGA